MKTDDEVGGRAFPVPHEWATRGMSLRDWFAGQALVGFLGNASLINKPTITIEEAATTVNSAYAYADLMLAERSK